MPDLELILLGRPALRRDGHDLTASLPQKGIALLAWLAATGRPVARSTLAGLLWPEMDEESARANLRLTLSRLRPAVGNLIDAGRTDIAYNAAAPHALDLHAVEHALAAGRLAEAVACYHGDFLADFQIQNAPEFDQWAVGVREELRRRVVGALDSLSAQQAGAGEHEAAAATLRRWIALARWDEEAHRRLIGLLAHNGQRVEALAQVDACRRALAQELDVEPDAQTLALAAAIRSGELPALDWADGGRYSVFGGRYSVVGAQQPDREYRTPNPEHRIPTTEYRPPNTDHRAPTTEYRTPNTDHRAPTTEHRPPNTEHRTPDPDYPLVGREQEQREIGELFARPGVRLVTLVGPGGVGKTRLALAFAASCPPACADESAVVWLAGLAPDTSDEVELLLLSNIARAVGLVFNAAMPPRALLLDTLAGRRLLLVLDNFEQVRAGATLLVDMLAAAPDLRLLVTSRARLGLPQEWVYAVRGLAYPENGDPAAEINIPYSVAGDRHPATGDLLAGGLNGTSFADHRIRNAEHGTPITDYPAVRLFVEAAQRVRPDFDAAAEAPAVAAVCRLVQGQPLGLLLAAQWARALRTDEIAGRLASDIDLLATQGAAVDPRHRSLRAVWDASWTLLAPDEQRALRRLSLFAAPFEAAAAERVAGAALPLLAALVDRSLLQRVGERFGFHALLRQYAAEQLRQQPDELQTTRDALLAWYCALLRAQRPLLEQADGHAAVHLLETELENLRTGWEIALAREDAAVAADYLEGLVAFLRRQGWTQEAVLVLTQAMQLPGATIAQRARWERLLGECMWYMGIRREAAKHYERALTLHGWPPPRTRLGQVGALAQGLGLQMLRRAGLAVRAGRALDPAAADTVCAVHSYLGQLHFFDGDQLRLTIAGVRALNLAESHALPEWCFTAYSVMALGSGLAGRTRMAAGFRRRAQEWEPRAADPNQRGYARTALGAHCIGAGLWAEAERVLRLAVADHESTGDQRRCTEAMACLGKMLYYIGRYDEALSWHKHVLESAAPRRSPSGIQWAILGEAEVRIRTGADPTAFLSAVRSVEHVTDEYLGPAEIIRMHGLLTLCLLATGDAAAAHAQAQQGLARIRQKRLSGFWGLEGYDGVAVALLRLWKQARRGEPGALPDAAALEREAEEAVRALRSFANYFPFTRARAALRLGDWEHAHGRLARARMHYRRALAYAEPLGLPYEASLARAALQGG